MLGSKYNPLKNEELTKRNLNFNGQGKQALGITAGECTNIDLKIIDDCLLTGASIIVKDSNFGDKYTAQIVDVEGIFYPAGTVLLQFITNYGISSDIQDQGSLEVGYPAKIIGNLYIRVIYNSTGTINPSILINYHLHKVLS